MGAIFIMYIIYIINMKEYIIDGILGGIIFGLISYLSFIYKKNEDFHKILGFMWAAPLTYFFLLYIVSKNDKKAILNFSKHCIIGTIISIILLVTTLHLIKLKKNMIILFAFIYSIFFVLLYFYFEVYKY